MLRTITTFPGEEKIYPLLMMSLKNKLVQGPCSRQEEVGTTSKYSMANRIPLQIRILLETTITSDELAHMSTLQIVGLIRVPIDHLEK
jgi:hypothetical protein